METEEANAQILSSVLNYNDAVALVKEIKDNNNIYPFRQDMSPKMSSSNTSVKFSACKTFKKEKIYMRLVFLCICALLVVVISFAIVSYVKLRSCEEKLELMPDEDNVCAYSKEATRIGLRVFLERVRDEYFRVCPEDIAWHPESTYEMVRYQFEIHNPRPEHIKKVSEKAEALHQEAIDLVSTR